MDIMSCNNKCSQGLKFICTLTYPGPVVNMTRCNFTKIYCKTNKSQSSECMNAWSSKHLLVVILHVATANYTSYESLLLCVYFSASLSMCGWHWWKLQSRKLCLETKKYFIICSEERFSIFLSLQSTSKSP